ncbi:MAG: hypothetical protein R3B09_21220 [Nannocystaceae bacterium]
MTITSGSTGEGICLQALRRQQQGHLPQRRLHRLQRRLPPLCETSCDPLLQDCAGNDEGCYAVLANDKFICAKSGYDMGKGNDGDDCYTIQSCKPGLICIAGEVLEGCNAERCCTPVCDLTGMGDECMAATEECVSPWAMGEEPPEYEDVGLCTIPG